MNTPNDLLPGELQVDETLSAHIKESAMWARFLGVLGFIYSAFISLIAVFMGFFIRQLMPAQMLSPAIMAGGLMAGAVYFVMSVITFFVSLYLYRFGTKVQTALRTADQQLLTDAFASLKFYFRFWGIAVLVTLALLLLALAAGVVSNFFR
jgi:divalent metal cation (Fe/Co/Zn/Cd) transporter